MAHVCKEAPPVATVANCPEEVGDGVRLGVAFTDAEADVCGLADGLAIAVSVADDVCEEVADGIAVGDGVIEIDGGFEGDVSTEGGLINCALPPTPS